VRQNMCPRLHTLGPAGTNCEAAARYWLNERGEPPDCIVLHDTLEQAVVGVLQEPKGGILLGCIVYPRLHEIVFRNLARMSLRECFVYPTHSMVLACSRAVAVSGMHIATVVSHPAPVDLLEGLDVQILSADSNSQAASRCARGETDGCITTIVAAQANGLHVVKDFGPVAMGYSIHAPVGTDL
jgi:prephenate dehydratase